MKNSSFISKVAVISGLALGAFAVAALADWTAPHSAPATCITDPTNANYDAGCNAPLHVGYEAQIKNGTLDIKGLVSAGVSAVNGFIVENGNVGIGTVSPGKKLDVQGGPINAGGGLIIETRTAAQGDPASPETGRMWLITP